MDLTLTALRIERPLAALDLESTGVDASTARIVEVAVLKLLPEGRPRCFRRLINPGGVIPPAATAVHGLGNADVADAPAFGDIAAELAQFLGGSDLAGFGIAGFDLPLLCAEFARAGVPFRVGGRAVLDALDVYRRRERRDLTSAVRFYLGREHGGAHSAAADARAAIEVLDRQVRRYGLPRAPAALHAELIEVDVARRFRRDADGTTVFAFGKYAGRTLAEIASRDPSYLRWMLNQPFLDDAQELARRALAQPPTASDC